MDFVRYLEKMKILTKILVKMENLQANNILFNLIRNICYELVNINYFVYIFLKTAADGFFKTAKN